MIQHKNYDKDVNVSAGARDRKKLAVQAKMQYQTTGRKEC